MITITNTLEKNLAVETARVGHIENQLEDISSKIDELIATISKNNIENINRYNRLSERITVLEASKEQTKYLLSFVVVGLTILEILLKWVI